jgi:DNA-binding transcriptional LysR family regulator
MPNTDWNDFRYILAVADAGSIVAAARRLGVTHSTVLRRVNAFEHQTGARLFERLASGYKLTPGGEEMVEIARAMAQQLATLDRRIAGRDRRTSGTVRMTTTDSLLATVVMRHLGGLTKAYPDIRLEISSASGMLDLSAREADIALRATANPPETLVGWRIGDLAFAIYGPSRKSRGNVEKSNPLHHPGELKWLAPSGGIARTRVGDYFTRHAARFQIIATFDSFRAISDGIAAGLGYGMLPCYFGDASPGVRRVGPVVDELTIGLWLLTHQDLRAVPRVRAVMDFFNAALVPDKDRFAGLRPG